MCLERHDSDEGPIEMETANVEASWWLDVANQGEVQLKGFQQKEARVQMCLKLSLKCLFLISSVVIIFNFVLNMFYGTSSASHVSILCHRAIPRLDVVGVTRIRDRSNTRSAGARDVK